MENILKFLTRDAEDFLDIAVVGDAMIDEYHDVEVNKISPECPVPILKSDLENPITLPGGAANVAYQFTHFNFNAHLYAYVDAEARRQLSARQVHAGFSVGILNPIPRKKRFYCGDIVVGRWDVEQKDYGLPNTVHDALTANLYSNLQRNNYKCVIFSDYGKGLFNTFDNSLLTKFPITIVDPKNGDLSRWKGCTIFKPNEAEALRLTGKNSVDEAGWHLVEQLGAAVLITQAGKGVSIYQQAKEVVRVRPLKRLSAAESVIGAGDCFVCFLAMALCRGLELEEAVSLAFHAGVLYVRNKHNKPLTPHDLARYADPCGSKIKPDKRIFANRDFKLAFTNGCFDLLHVGHIESLRFAKSQADRLVVAVNSDESVAKLKAGRPILPLEQRMAMLAACEYVDYVVPFYEDTPYEVIKQICPDVLIKGEDYRDKVVVGADIVPKVVYCPLFEGQSTSKIIEQISRSS